MSENAAGNHECMGARRLGAPLSSRVSIASPCDRRPSQSNRWQNKCLCLRLGGRRYPLAESLAPMSRRSLAHGPKPTRTSCSGVLTATAKMCEGLAGLFLRRSCRSGKGGPRARTGVRFESAEAPGGARTDQDGAARVQPEDGQLCANFSSKLCPTTSRRSVKERQVSESRVGRGGY